MMLSLFFTPIISITLMLSQAVKPRQRQRHMTLRADGAVQQGPTFDMLVSSDVGHFYALADWP